VGRSRRRILGQERAAKLKAYGKIPFDQPKTIRTLGKKLLGAAGKAGGRRSSGAFLES
jgi:hypothetical protein